MNFISYGKERFKDSSWSLTFLLYGFICIFSIIFFAIKIQVRNLILAILGLIAIPTIFILFECVFKLKLSSGFVILALFIVIGGMQLGPCYDWYFIFPHFDDFLHFLSGILFGLLGFGFVKRFIPDGNFYLGLTGGVIFSLAIATLWELVEFFGTSFLGIDMQEDSLVNSINSFFLVGSHNNIQNINDIYQTVIYFGDGNSYIIDGGYLDLGVYDTLFDLLTCGLGSLLYSAMLLIDKKCHFGLEKVFVPIPIKM